MKQVPEEYYQIMEQLQAVDFVLVELTLYLDTHPDDLEAINQFNHYVKENALRSCLRVNLVLCNNLGIATLDFHGTGRMPHGRGKSNIGR